MAVERRARDSQTIRWMLSHGLTVRLVSDLGIWAVALTVAILVRYDLAAWRIKWGGLALAIALAVGLQVVFGVISGLYRGWWRYGTLEEVGALAWTVGVVATTLAAVDAFFASRPVPLGAALGGGVFALVGMAAPRALWRLVVGRRQRPRVGEGTTRLLIFGAGDGGYQVLRALLGDPTSAYIPVALIDDDPRKRNLQLMGVRVLGSRTRLVEVAARVKAEAILLAVPSAAGELVRAVEALAEQAGIPLKVLPPVAELYWGRVGSSDIRDVTEEDLLGRRPLDTDVASIAGYITGRRVLVTGAGGSIGSELCRQLERFGPAELMMLDRDESALHATQLSIEGRALLDSDNLILADIRDRITIEAIFRERRPEVVFHAAALKHLTLLERHPGEALRTNVWGTWNVFQAAGEAGVGRFINISTDKAAGPISVLGYSKRIAERLCAQAIGDMTSVSVRFGNVLGSRGSVLGAFRAQAAAGRDLTVTDPDVTRYFMTVSESVELVIQAGAIGAQGEVLVLDMGEPVRILDVAERIARQADPPVGIEFTGLRPGEKLHEVLLGPGEESIRRIHPLISHLEVKSLDGIDGLRFDPAGPGVAERLRALATDDVVLSLD